MATFVAYQTETGFISEVRQTDASKIADTYRPSLSPGYDYLETTELGVMNDETKYYVDVLENIVKSRPVFDAPASVTMTLGDDPLPVVLPVGTVVSQSGVTVGTIDESGVLNLVAALDGEYELKLGLWPYLPGSIKVRVNAADPNP